MKNFFLLFCYLLFTACSSLSDAGKVMRNEKIRTTDEFLVEKRKTLVLPPDFSEIPKPNSLKDKKKNDDEKIKEILKAPIDENIRTNKSSNLEKTILDNIRK
tara:strand:- start:434 stop:739 length:306 start_codon:yes stop_codon:yes gene_type:complete